MVLNNISISRKLTLGFAAVVSIVLAMSVTVLANIGAIEAAAAAKDQQAATLASANDALMAQVNELSTVRGYVATGDASFPPRLAAYQRDFEAAIARLKGQAAGDADLMARIEALQAEAAKVKGEWDTQMALRADPATAAQAQATLLTAGRVLKSREIMSGIFKHENALVAARTADEARAYAATRIVLIGGGLACMLLSAAIGWLLSRGIASPVSAMTGAMGRLAAGDHTVAIPAVGRRDEVGRMAGAVQTFKDAAIEKLRLEAEAAQQREAAEASRRAAEAERTRVAQEQALVVGALADGLEKLSGGVLTWRLTEAFAPAYEKLRADFNAAMDKLQETMTVVAANTVGIRTGTDEISHASDDLSRRTEQQAASLEETAAALDEITATVRKTAQGAATARDAVGAARADAEQSGVVVRQAVQAMSGIEASAQQISQIIGVIDEIAFQTNLLALNAGVEAARAGDAGRGFAVVASEVRALAQRSAEAAKEIKTLISASTAQVDAGVDLVGQTGQALERIVGHVGQLSALVIEIAASTQEQAVGLNQVNTAINQMDQVTQQNAAMVEESTAASHALAQEAMTLARLIEGFEVGGAARPARRAAA
ncbi:methyl-accepting chemotaxis protein [Caulobacter sp. KR2-114]|uniref:methyl-accepting chemotaxis protein n=1 Tax=Caulobacter sp. KR2-114 TaxID=3400912 RepID=UPI003C122DB9